MSGVGGGASSGDVESMRKDLDKILGRDEHGTAQVVYIIMVVMIIMVMWMKMIVERRNMLFKKCEVVPPRLKGSPPSPGFRRT